MFVLFSIVISIVLGIVDSIFGFKFAGGTGLFGGLFSLAILIPSIAVGVRRLHDTNHSGWWYFIGLIPIIGAIVLIVFWASDSAPGDNQYGPNPKGALNI